MVEKNKSLKAGGKVAKREGVAVKENKEKE